MATADSQSAEAIVNRWTIVISAVALGVPFLLIGGMAIVYVFERAMSVPFEVNMPKIGDGPPLTYFYSHVANLLRRYSCVAALIFLIKAVILLIKAVISLCLASVFSAMFVGWPFLVLHKIVEKNIRARWPIIGGIHWADAGSLIGLSIPYVFFFVFAAFGDLTSVSPEAGDAIGIAALFVFIFDGMLAVTGWFTGELAWAISSFFKHRR